MKEIQQNKFLYHFSRNLLYRLIDIIRIIFVKIKILSFKNINEYSKKNSDNSQKKN